MKRLFCLCALVFSGCFKLDPFIYVPVRLEKYTLPAEGKTPEETVSKDRIEEVTISVNDEVKLGAAYVRAAVSPPVGYVLVFHGQGGNVDTHLWRAKRLANIGFDALIFDYRGWGASSNVTPTEEGLAEDAAAARAWFENRIGSGVNRLFYYGNSFGTAVVTPFASKTPPKALVLESGFASLEAFKNDSSQMDFPLGFIATAEWATSKRIRDVKVPVLVMHGTADDYVRKEFSEEIYKNANEPKKLILVEGAVHSGIPEVLGPDYEKVIKEFVVPYLP